MPQIAEPAATPATEAPKPAQPAKPAKEAAKKNVPTPNSKAHTAKGEERKTVYPDLKAALFVADGAADGAKGPITEEVAKKMLKWETEADFAKRLIAANPDLKPEQCLFGDDFILRDEEGAKVRCWNNVGNRPFDEPHCRALAQSILTKRWADSRSGPDMSINGETIVLTKTGRVDSGQHRLIAVILAAQIWRKDPKRWPLWTEAPSIESAVVVGVSENPRVTQTLDEVKPRSVSDVLYTSGHFAKLSTKHRQECSRMLQKSIEFLWKRTNGGGFGTGKDGSAYLTNAMAVDFLERHPTIEKLVKHLFDENADRGISLLRLSPGMMAGVCWLMGSSASDPAAYRKGMPPKEKSLNWTRQAQAEAFFVQLVSDSKNLGTADGQGQLTPLVRALGTLVGDEDGLGGRTSEKLAILAKAWAVLAADPKAKLTDADVSLKDRYHDDELGQRHLLPDEAGYLNNFGGCDLGERPAKAKTEDGEDPADIEAAKEEAKAETQKQAQKPAAKPAEAKPKTPTPKAATPAKPAQAAKPKPVTRK